VYDKTDEHKKVSVSEQRATAARAPAIIKKKGRMVGSMVNGKGGSHIERKRIKGKVKNLGPAHSARSVMIGFERKGGSEEEKKRLTG